MAGSFVFPPPLIVRPPGSAQPDPRKGHKGQSGPITRQTPEPGTQEQVRPSAEVLRKLSGQGLPQRRRPMAGHAG